MNFKSEIAIYLPFVLIRNVWKVQPSSLSSLLFFLFHLDQKCRIFVTAYNLCLVGGLEWSVWG